MNRKTISGLLVAAAIGGAIGFYGHARLSQSMQVTLAVGQFSTRLMEDSTTLTQIKKNDLVCLRSRLTFSVKNDLAQVPFYRNLAASDERGLRLINESADFAQQALAASDIPTPAGGKPCP